MQQSKTLNFVKRYMDRQGCSPTLEEIGRGVGIRSKGAAHRLVRTLIDKGYLIRESSNWRALRLAQRDTAPSLPLLGRIAAGYPIEAIPGEDTLNLAEFLLGSDRYALRVVGDSMIGAGILNGDTVVVHQTDAARDGDIVVALIDNQEATLKRLKRRRDGQVELIADNPAMLPLVYPAGRVNIQGVVVAQMRSYR